MPAPYELIQSNDHGTMKIGALRILSRVQRFHYRSHQIVPVALLLTGIR